MGRAEAVRTFLKWISGETSPTIYVSFWKKKRENLLAEPAKRDTAAAVALGTGWVAAHDHAATMAVLPADHVIANRAAFQETLALAAETAEETGELVAIGIKPTWACPGFGYIEQGEQVHFRNGSDKGR